MNEQMIEPCPFCERSDPVLCVDTRARPPHLVRCAQCGGRGPLAEASTKAIRLWNTRAAHSVMAGKVAELAYAVWMVGNMDTDEDKTQWWSNFEGLWKDAGAIVGEQAKRGVPCTEGFEAYRAALSPDPPDYCGIIQPGSPEPYPERRSERHD